MSLKTWKKEFFPPMDTSTELGAIIHSLRKWRGLRPENMKKHGVKKHLTSTREIVDRRHNSLEIDAYSCALCWRHTLAKNGNCFGCSLLKQLESECDLHDNSPYVLFLKKNEVEPMIEALEQTLLANAPLIEDGFGNYTSLYCLKCLRPTMQVVRPGSFQCSKCV